jgi:hypothetical protein
MYGVGRKHIGLIWGLMIGLAPVLGACAAQHGAADSGGDQGVNAYPANYKADIVAAMHAYLNDPTGIRDASISEPTLRSATVNMPARYVGCVRFNAKKTATVYQGMREVAAVFVAGRFDSFVEQPKELCAGVTYAPYPELEKIAR